MIQSAFLGDAYDLNSVLVGDERVKPHLNDQHDRKACVVDLPNQVYLFLDLADEHIQEKIDQLAVRFADVTVASILLYKGKLAPEEVIHLLEQLPSLRYLYLGDSGDTLTWPVLRMPELLEFTNLTGKHTENLSLPKLQYLITESGFPVEELNQLLDTQAFPMLEHLGFGDEYHAEKLSQVHWPDGCFSVGLHGLWGEDDIECLASQPWAKRLQRIETCWGEYAPPSMFNERDFPALRVLKLGYEFDPPQFVECFAAGDIPQVTLLDFRAEYGAISFDADYYEDGKTYSDFAKLLPAGITVDVRHCGHENVELPELPVTTVLK